uniref:Uncharacterized protein n=1 Tax=Oryza meridionalis TaxID=40149 RepID=A0A0E0E3E7_9ORYZ
MPREISLLLPAAVAECLDQFGSKKVFWVMQKAVDGIDALHRLCYLILANFLSNSILTRVSLVGDWLCISTGIIIVYIYAPKELETIRQRRMQELMAHGGVVRYWGSW